MVNYYENVDVKNGESQYEDYDLNKNSIVNAIYVHALHPRDKGNIFVEALPVPRANKNIVSEYTKELAFYNEPEIKNMTLSEKLLSMKRIRELRLPLPFVFELEEEFHSALVMSYSSRKFLEDLAADIDCDFKNQVMYQHSKLVGDPAASSIGYFSLLGISGSGKSSAVYTLLSRYPQVIVHDMGENNRIIQVTYLVVNCVACSNFTALYIAIGHALDIALHNLNDRYSTEIDKQRTLGKKALKVQELIEKFKIGCLILDEIQEISFDSINENSFNSLLTIVNNTKIALISVGTEEAYDKMHNSLRLCRRAGAPISSQLYCNFRQNGIIDHSDPNERYFRLLLSGIFKYQWFDKRVELTEDIINAFYDVTRGIIDQIITIYILVHVEYFKNTVKPKINGEFIHKVAKTRCGATQKHLKNIDNMGLESLIEIAAIKAEADREINKMIIESKVKNNISKIIHDEKKINQSIVTLHQVNAMFSSASTFFDFSPEEISTAFNKVKNSKAGKEQLSDIKAICKLVQKQVERTRKKIAETEKAGSNSGAGSFADNFSVELGMAFLNIDKERKKDEID